MQTPRLQPCHLGSPHIKVVGASAEGAGAAAALVVGLQQLHPQPRFGEQAGGCEPGDAGADHGHIDAGTDLRLGTLIGRRGLGWIGGNGGTEAVADPRGAAVATGLGWPRGRGLSPWASGWMALSVAPPWGVPAPNPWLPGWPTVWG